MDRFNLNLFFALDAILHANSLTEAAHRIHLSQPAMSAALKKLRAYFDDELIVSKGGTTRLTPLAEALKPRIRQVLQGSREALDLSLDFDPATDRRTVRVTAADVVELFYLSRVVGTVARQAPGVDIVSAPFTYCQVDALFREGIDIAIVSEAFTMPQFPVRPLFEDTISCMVWDGNAAIGDTLSESQYFGARHAAMFRSAEGQTHPVGAALHRINQRRDIAVRASVYSALPHMIVGTELIVTTLTRFARACAQTMPVRVLPMPVEVPSIAFVAQWQHYRSDEGIIRWMLDQLTTAAQGL